MGRYFIMISMSLLFWCNWWR